MSDFSKRLRNIRKEMSLSLDAFGALADVTGAAQSNYETGKRSPNIEYLERLKTHGLDVDFLLWGKSLTNVKTKGDRNLSGAVPAPASDSDAIYVPLYSATGSMGPGNELVTEDVILGDVPLSRTWISNNLPRCRPTALKMVHAYGDSMHGTLESGDFALVDTDVQSVEIDGVYVLQAHNRLFIKRVRQRMDGCYEVSSDNPAIKQTDILSGKHEVQVCGRVVYGWNGRRF